jgi:AraC-like DNA-binding protein
MDVLSEILKVVRLEGALFFNGEFSAPWCVNSAASPEVVPYLSPSAGHMIIFHFLTEGRAYVRLPQGQRQDLKAGDIVVVPHGNAHYLGNGAPVKAVNSLGMFAKNLTQGLKLARFGGGGEVTRLVCGYMVCEPRLSEIFLAGLPDILVVPVGSEPAGQWLGNSIRFSVGDGEQSDAGSGLVLAKLSELLFVETLRRYISTLPPERVGWLAGARDPMIGKSLALLHKAPEHPWTIADLARSVGLSRTRMVERFRHFLGISPMAYLAQWRLRLGAQILQSSEDSVAEIAAAVGYGSESAFNRAFKREFHCPPAQFRRKQKAAPVPQRGKGAANSLG